MVEKSYGGRVVKRYSEALKRKIVEEVQRGECTVLQACRDYDISDSRTIYGWIKRYGNYRGENKVVRVMMKSEQDRIKELERALADEKIRSMVFAAQLREYEKLVPDFKKKLGTKALKQFEKNEERIKAFR